MKAKHAKKKTAKKKATAPRKPKQEAAKTPKKDALGFRIGSQAALINRHIGKKMVTVEDLVKATKLPTHRVKQHLRWSVIKELAEKTPKGFRLVR